jgi:hypothetical protein
MPALPTLNCGLKLFCQRSTVHGRQQIQLPNTSCCGPSTVFFFVNSPWYTVHRRLKTGIKEVIRKSTLFLTKENKA